MFCPNKIAGCGPLAITMVMTYIKPATSLSLTFPERPYDHLDIDWAEIVKHNKSLGIKNPTDIEIASHYNNCGASDDVHVKLGALIREIGYRGNCFYEDNGTGMWTSDAKMMLDQMIPGQDGEYAQPSQFYDKLSSKGVGFVYGSAGTSAHFWVADGVANITHVITRYYNYNPKTKECDYSEGETRVEKFIHYNWGWGGQCNGYFLEGVFDPYKSTTNKNWHGVKSRTSYKYNTFAYIYY